MLSFRCWESVGDFLIHFSLVANRVNHAIRENADGSFAAPSHTSNRTYEVRLLGDRFVYTCPDFGYRQIDACMHIHAVKLWIAARTPQLQNELKSKFFADDAISCTQWSLFESILFDYGFDDILGDGSMLW